MFKGWGAAADKVAAGCEKWGCGGIAGKLEMRASFEYYRSTDCTELRVIATNLFNSMVGRRRY